MEYRTLGRTGWNISVIGFGAWGIGGGDWGNTDDKTSLAALHRAIDLGVNFIDTADVYGDGHSERLIAEVRKARSEQLIIAIIFNMFRFKPSEQFFAAAREHRVGILARVPLASGLLTGKFNSQTQFGANDHRMYNRHGEAFDQGETFSGVDYETGLQAVEELRTLVPEGATMAQFALRWILMFPEVSSTIAGAKNQHQIKDNVHAASLQPLSDETMRRVR